MLARGRNEERSERINSEEIQCCLDTPSFQRSGFLSFFSLTWFMILTDLDQVLFSPSRLLRLCSSPLDDQQGAIILLVVGRLERQEALMKDPVSILRWSYSKCRRTGPREFCFWWTPRVIICETPFPRQKKIVGMTTLVYQGKWQETLIFKFLFKKWHEKDAQSLKF